MAILNVLHLDPRISFFELFLKFVESAQLSRPRDQELIAMTMKTWVVNVMRVTFFQYFRRQYHGISRSTQGAHAEFQSQSQLAWPVKHDWSVDDLLISIGTESPGLYITLLDIIM
ncbi:hypothetical protein ACHAPG_000204 [Botrytis cinerea]